MSKCFSNSNPVKKISEYFNGILSIRARESETSGVETLIQASLSAFRDLYFRCCHAENAVIHSVLKKGQWRLILQAANDFFFWAEWKTTGCTHQAHEKPVRSAVVLQSATLVSLEEYSYGNGWRKYLTLMSIYFERLFIKWEALNDWKKWNLRCCECGE